MSPELYAKIKKLSDEQWNRGHYVSHSDVVGWIRQFTSLSFAEASSMAHNYVDDLWGLLAVLRKPLKPMPEQPKPEQPKPKPPKTGQCIVATLVYPSGIKETKVLWLDDSSYEADLFHLASQVFTDRAVITLREGK